MVSLKPAPASTAAHLSGLWSPRCHAPAPDDPGGIDPVLPLYRGEGLVDIDLARPAVGVVGPAEDVQFEVSPRRRRRGVVLGQEADLAEAAVAPMKDQVETQGGFPIVAGRYDQAVGLDASVDPGAVGAREASGRPQPARLARLEGGRALETGIQHLQCLLDIALVVELFRVAQQPLGRLGVDLHIEEAVLRYPDHRGPFPELVQSPPELVELPADLPDFFPGGDVGIG